MRTTHFTLLGCLLLTCVASCQSGLQDQSFPHKYRADYAISDTEFEEIEFMTSAEVIVRAIGEAPKFDATGSGIIIAPKGTSGEVVAVGPDWLRVTFGLGDGVYFKTDTAKEYDNYWFATEVEGKEGLFLLRDMDEAVLLIDGDSYEVVRGGGACLRVNVDSWRKFVASRTHAPGKRAGGRRANAPVTE